MKTAAIIAEYNPFHNGHAYHLEQTRAAGCGSILAVMSGNYVQRGSPAVADKWIRAEAAVVCGADLVLELPLPWALASAERFAGGGVTLAEATGVVDVLSFGCENDSVCALQRTSDMMDTASFRERLHSKLAEGKSYPRAVGEACMEIGEPSAYPMVSQPNNTLALAYIRALRRTNIEPLPILRTGAAHDAQGDCEGAASASHIREQIYRMYNDNKELYELYKTCPSPAAAVFEKAHRDGAFPLDRTRFDIACLSRLRRMTAAELQKAPDMTEGIENKIYTAIQSSATLETLFDNAKTKRYTHARLRRSILCAVLGIDAQMTRQTIPYLRVLAFNDRGRILLRSMKKKAALPIVMRHADTASLDSFGKELFQLEAAAADLYSLCLPKPGICGDEFTKQIYYERTQ